MSSPVFTLPITLTSISPMIHTRSASKCQKHRLLKKTARQLEDSSNIKSHCSALQHSLQPGDPTHPAAEPNQPKTNSHGPYYVWADFSFKKCFYASSDMLCLDREWKKRKGETMKNIKNTILSELLDPHSHVAQNKNHISGADLGVGW